MASLTKAEITALINAGQTVLLRNGNNYTIIDDVSEIPSTDQAILDGIALSAVFNTHNTNSILGHPINGTPSNGQTLVYNSTTGNFDFGSGGTSLPVIDSTTVIVGSVDNTKGVRFEVDGLTTGTTRVITVPDSDFTLVGTGTSQVITNKKFYDSSCTFVDEGDETKQFAIQCSGISTGTIRTWTVPNSSDTFVGLTATQTLTNKTLTTPTISSITNGGTITIPSGTLTLATLTGTETLTNKTLTAARIANGGFIADANGNEQIIFNTVASAVNEISHTNASTGNNPIMAVTGGDTNAGLFILSKGTGPVAISSTSFTPQSGVQLHVEKQAFVGREIIAKFTVSDGGNSCFLVCNATNNNGLFVPTMGGYADSANNIASFAIRGMVSAANDASDSATGGIVELVFVRTDSATDPLNGNITDVVNRKLLTVANATGSRLLTFYPSANLVLVSGGTYSFSSSATNGSTPDTGAVRAAAATWRFSDASTGSGKILIAPSSASITGNFTVLPNSATTNAAVDVARFGINSTGTATTGFGPRISLSGESASADDRAMCQISSIWTTATDASRTADLIFELVNSATMAEVFRIKANALPVFPTTVTAGGTTGNQTINKPTGTVNIAAAGTSVTVTNSLVSANSIVYAVIRTNDSTATIKNVVPSAGSFVITLGAAATAEVSIGFTVFN